MARDYSAAIILGLIFQVTAGRSRLPPGLAVWSLSGGAFPKVTAVGLRLICSLAFPRKSPFGSAIFFQVTAGPVRLGQFYCKEPTKPAQRENS